MVDLGLQHQVMGYDRTSAMFSPEGHLLQVEYAEKAVRLGAASIGMVCSDGVLIVTDKRIKNKLIVAESASKIYEVDSHIAATAAGYLSDARILIEKVQLAAQQHRVMYDSPIETEIIIKEIANNQQLFSSYGGTRPLAVKILAIGIDDNLDKKLFVTDVVGNYFGYKAAAIGENDDKIEDMLLKEYKEGINISEGIKLGLSIFKKILGKDFDITRFEVGFIKREGNELKKIGGEELKKY